MFDFEAVANLNHLQTLGRRTVNEDHLASWLSPWKDSPMP